MEYPVHSVKEKQKERIVQLCSQKCRYSPINGGRLRVGGKWRQFQRGGGEMLGDRWRNMPFGWKKSQWRKKSFGWTDRLDRRNIADQIT